MNWHKRCKRRETATGTLRRWPAHNSPYAVVEARSALGLPTRWLAIAQVQTGEYVISRHRTKARAVRACELHQRGRN